MASKIQARLRRGAKVKARISRQDERLRLVVSRSALHTSAQIVKRTEKGDQVVAAVSTNEKEIRDSLKGTKVERANKIGEILAKRAKEQKVESVAFDRSGFKYHGRVKALADGARAAGLNF